MNQTVSYNKDPNFLDNCSPFELTAMVKVAFMNLDYEFIKTLVEFGADINLPVNSGAFPIWCDSIRYEHADVCKMFLDLGANPNCRTSQFGYTPLHLAYEYNNPEIIDILLKHGADPDVRSQDGLKPSDLKIYQLGW